MEEKKDSLQMLPDKKKRLLGGGRKVNNPDMEEELVVWISNLNEKNKLRPPIVAALE